MEFKKINGVGLTVDKWPLDLDCISIVFIHGAGGTGAFWRYQLTGLAKKFNTIAIDLPGHGESENDGSSSIEDYSREMVDILSDAAIPNPVLCGFSMGGAITQQILLDYPDLARAGILICSGAKMPVGKAIFESIRNDYKGFVDFLCKIASSKNTRSDVVRPFRKNLLGTKAGTTYNDFQACNQFDVIDRLPAISVPVLVITAEEDKLTPPVNGTILQKSISKAFLVHIKDAGHIVANEKPGEVNEAIADFLERQISRSFS